MTDAVDAAPRATTATGRSERGRRTRRAPLGRDFGKLWTAAAFSNLADGLGRTAVPLIATTLTRDPLAISRHRRAGVPALARLRPAGRHDRRPVRPPHRSWRSPTACAAPSRCGSRSSPSTGQINLWALFARHARVRAGRDAVRQRDQRHHPGRRDSGRSSIAPTAACRRRRSRSTASSRRRSRECCSPSRSRCRSGSAPPATSSRSRSPSCCRCRPRGRCATPARGARPRRSPDVEVAAAGSRSRSRRRCGSVDRSTRTRSVVYLWRNRYLRSMVVFTSLVGSAFSFAQARTILYFLDEQSVAPAAIGFVTAGIGVGALIGSLVAPRSSQASAADGSCSRANFVAAAAMLARPGLAPERRHRRARLRACSRSRSRRGTCRGARCASRSCPAHLFGRVLGIIRMLTWGLFPIATLLGGWVARFDLRLPVPARRGRRRSSRRLVASRAPDRRHPASGRRSREAAAGLSRTRPRRRAARRPRRPRRALTMTPVSSSAIGRPSSQVSVQRGRGWPS